MDNRFFTWVRNYNVVAIALGITLLLGLLIWEMTSSWRRESFPTQGVEAPSIAPSTENEGNSATTPRAYFGPPTGTTPKGVYALPRYVENQYANSGISKGNNGNLTNYFLIDNKDQSKRWLFEGQSRLITDTRAIHFRRADGKAPFLGSLLLVIDTDTNADQRLSRKDTAALYFVAPDWAKPLLIIEGVNTMLATEATSESALDIMVRSQENVSLITLSLLTSETISQMEFSVSD